MKRVWAIAVKTPFVCCAWLAGSVYGAQQESPATAPSKDVTAATDAFRKPNVVFILADDLGYGDLGCYGQNQILTPQLDRLAKEGMRFTNHYAGSTVCAPSRCCLLTGRHTGHVPIRGNRFGALSGQDVTIGQVLQRAGYDTAVIGKWGLGPDPPPGDPEKFGFAYFFGCLENVHAHNHFPDYLWRNSDKVSIQGNVVKTVGRGGVALKRSQYAHDLYTEEALKFIGQNHDKPFFLYLPFTVPHANNEAGQDGMEVPDDSPYSDRPWPAIEKNHAAMITRLDKSVGQIVALLQSKGIDKNTLVLFSSDNGPHHEGGADPAFFKSSGSLRGHKRDLYEGGIRVPLVAWWPGTIQPGQVSDHVSAFWDLMPTLAEIARVEPPKGDGISFAPTLLGQREQPEHKFLYWEFHERGSVQAVRFENWKLVRRIGVGDELYDLANDPSETRNVAAENPVIVKVIDFFIQSSHTPSAGYPLAAPAQRD